MDNLPRRLQLSGIELGQMTDWPAPLIEDYLQINETLNEIVEIPRYIDESITTAGNENILIHGSTLLIPVQLNPRAIDGERVRIKVIDTASIAIVGLIDGVLGKVLVSGESILVIFFRSSGGWHTF